MNLSFCGFLMILNDKATFAFELHKRNCKIQRKLDGIFDGLFSRVSKKHIFNVGLRMSYNHISKNFIF